LNSRRSLKVGPEFQTVSIFARFKAEFLICKKSGGKSGTFASPGVDATIDTCQAATNCRKSFKPHHQGEIRSMSQVHIRPFRVENSIRARLERQARIERRIRPAGLI
jgi:hypothetical protein